MPSKVKYEIKEVLMVVRICTVFKIEIFVEVIVEIQESIFTVAVELSKVQK